MMTMNSKNTTQPTGDTKKLLLVAVVLMAILFVAGFFVLSGPMFNRVFNNFAKIKPGLSSPEDVKKILGEPDAVNQKDGSTEYIYKTKSDFEDKVIIENNQVESSQQNVFNDKMGFVSGYVDKYGKPDLVLLNTNNPIEKWYIFLKPGVGVASLDDNLIINVIRFKSQSESEFLNSTAKSYDLAKEGDVKPNETSDYEIQAGQQDPTPQP